MYQLGGRYHRSWSVVFTAMKFYLHQEYTNASRETVNGMIDSIRSISGKFGAMKSHFVPLAGAELQANAREVLTEAAGIPRPYRVISCIFSSWAFNLPS